ncbi:hypothetical protein llg_28570 [Luteolibacter sp. LG18]|nr:hypothetical protein llg_28570 [Luteolibacter sp. LG18]
MPLFSDTADNILTILEQNRESQSSDELKLPLTKKMGSINDQELDEVWMSLALGVLREARETFREDRWNLISAKIDQRFGEALNSHDRYQYEKALWSLRKLSRKMTNAVLNSWNPSPRNPLAKMWKSSILSEIGQLVDARNLLLGALNEIRRSFTIQGRNTELFSLEGWCSFSLANIEANGASDYDSKRISEFHERWDELKAWDCDPRVLGQYFLHELAKPMPEMAPAVSKVTRSFDPGITTYQRSWRSDILVDFMPAFGCLRLFENAGLSMRNAYAGWKDAVIKACKWTAPFNSFGSTVIIACLIDAKKLDEEGFLTRIEVANMTDDDIGKFYDWAFNALRDELSDLQKTDTQKRNSLAVVQALVEILSRISFGLSEDKLNNVFRLAIDYFSNPQIRADSSALKVNHTLFKRVFYAADNSLLENWLMEVMKLPLNPIIDVYQRNRLDPIDVFPDGRCKSSSEIPTESFKKIFEDLLKVAASRNRPQSDDAFKRLFSLSAVGKTTSDQNEVLGREIWREVDDDGLPTIQVYGRSNFLFYPAPFNVDVADIVRKNILNQISKINGAFDTGEVRDMLQSIADSPCVFASTDSRVRPIDWTEKDSEILFEFIENWWKQAKAPLEGYSGDCPMPDDSFNPLTEAIGALSIVLARVIVPKMTWAEEADWDKVYSLSSDVEATGKYIYICLPFILMHRPQDCERVRLIIEENLNSVSEKRVKAGARAVGWWAWGRNIATLPPIPSTLIQSLVDRVCHRESLGLSAVVNILADILNSRAQEINSEIVSALARALISWQRGLFEKLENGDFKFNSDADLSQCCALGELASSIRKWLSHQGLNTADYPGILLWQETCEKNKLPELKRCFADFNSND